MQRRNSQSKAIDGKTERTSVNANIRQSKKLLNRVGRLKSHVKEAHSNTDELDMVPVKLQKSRNIPDIKNTTKSLGPRQINDPHFSSQRKSILSRATPSEKVKSAVFRKPKPLKNKIEMLAPENDMIVSSDILDDEIHPIGEPIIRNLAGQTGSYNIGFSSIVYEDFHETHLSGHILKGVDIVPNNVIEEKSLLIDNRETIDHLEEVDGLQSPCLRSNLNECRKSDQVEKFSWDKLSDSISLVVSEIQNKDKQNNKKTRNIDAKNVRDVGYDSTIEANPKNIESKSPPSRASSYGGYSMDFDQEIESYKSVSEPKDMEINSNVQKASEGTITENIRLSPRTPNEHENESINKKSSHTEEEEIHRADDIVHQIYNKLHLSLDSACSTISDRLSTIPEDPRSHEELAQFVSMEKIKSQTSSSSHMTIKKSDIADNANAQSEVTRSKEKEILNQENEDAQIYNSSRLNPRQTIIVTPKMSQDLCEGTSNHSLSEGPLSDDSLDRFSHKGSDDAFCASVPQETGSKIELRPKEFEKIESSVNESFKNESSLKTTLHKSDTSIEKFDENSKIMSVSKSTTSSSISNTPQISTDSSSDKRNIYVSSGDSKKELSSRISEMSNISEGQLLNCVPLSEGELSQTLKSYEDILKPNNSKEYLADESTNSSETNTFSVPKITRTQKIGIMPSCVSNKKRLQAKTRQAQLEHTSSSSGNNTSIVIDNTNEIVTYNVDSDQNECIASEGELSANSEQ